MGRSINRLTARGVQTIATPGRHADGGGLYLVIDPSGARRWVMLYRFGGKRREMGLGSTLSVPLVRARELAGEARVKIAAGTDPLTIKRQTAAKPTTFADIAIIFMNDREATWRNAAHRAQWRQTLEVQAAQLWSASVAGIDTDDILAVLRPIWHTKAETARRLRGRIERVLDAATARHLREGPNPARWRGHLDTILPRAAKLTRGHHAAMPYVDLPAFYAALKRVDTPSACALRLLILTATRSGEVRGAVWSEVNASAMLWTIPAERMKGKRIHRIPISTEAAAIFEHAREHFRISTGSEIVFPSARVRQMSDMVFAMLLRRFGHANITTHGFRSTFRDWVDNETEFPGDIAEAALAHLTGDKTERAYRRTDVLEKRRHLMDAWARFVASANSAD